MKGGWGKSSRVKLAATWSIYVQLFANQLSLHQRFQLWWSWTISGRCVKRELRGGFGTTWISHRQNFTSQLSPYQIFQVWSGWTISGGWVGWKLWGGYGATWILYGHTFTSQLSAHHIFHVWRGWASIWQAGRTKPSGWKCSYMETGFHHELASWDNINYFSCDEAGTISDSCELT